MNTAQRLWQSIKAATVRFGAGPWWGGWFLGSQGTYSYEQAIPDGGRDNSIVAACVRWMVRTMPEAPLVVRERTSGGEWEDRPDHRLQDVLDRPNPYYSGLHLWAATVADWMFGDAYWIKVRGGDGKVMQLWWMPSWMMEPKWDGADFISYYEQRVDGDAIRWQPEDVVHFRNGNDPRNPRKGLGLKAVIREVATDQEAAGWTVAMVHNVNPPGVIISPSGDMAITPENAERVKSTFSARFSGERRGEPLVMAAATKVDILSYSPEQMKLTEIRRVPEERITAYLGIPAIVVGVGAGLDRSTFANFSEAREAAYESCLIPTQRLFAADLNAQLVPDFGDSKRLRLAFDLSQVRVLQDDMNALSERVDRMIRAGAWTLNEGRLVMAGKPAPVDPIDGGDVLMLPGAWAPTPPAHLAALAAAPAPEPVTAPSPDGGTPPPDQQQEQPPPPAKARWSKRVGFFGDLYVCETCGEEFGCDRLHHFRDHLVRGHTKAASLSDAEIVARYEAGLAPLTETLANDLLDAFEAIAETAAGRLGGHGGDGTITAAARLENGQRARLKGLSYVSSQAPPNAGNGDHGVPIMQGAPGEHEGLRRIASSAGFANGHAPNGEHGSSVALKADAIGGLVTEADHAEIRSLLRSYTLKSMRQAAEDLAPLTGDQPVRIQRNNPAVKAAVADMESRLPGIAATTGEDFGRLVRRLERRPGSVPLADIQRALTDYVAENYPARSGMIAQTELAYGHAAGVVLVAEKSGIANHVHVHDGDQSDAACAHRNGTVVALADAAGIGLLHPNCLVGETVVLAPNVTGATVRSFDGEIVVLRTAAGDLLSCTPNHPILTDRGWIAAGDLRQGDYVVRCFDAQRVARLADPDHDHMPVSIQQVADAIGPAGGGASTAVPVAAEDFHGDGAGSQVCVVRTNSVSQRGRCTTLSEQPGETAIERTDMALTALTAERLLAEIIPRLRRTPDSSMGSRSIAQPAISAESFVAQTGRLAQGPDGNASVLQPSPDHGSARIEDHGNLTRATALIDVQPPKHIDARMFPRQAGMAGRQSELIEVSTERGRANPDLIGDLFERLAGLVALVEISEVDTRQFSGHVYNLETAQGWYVAQNIVTHNCRLRLVPVIE